MSTSVLPITNHPTGVMPDYIGALISWARKQPVIVTPLGNVPPGNITSLLTGVPGGSSGIVIRDNGHMSMIPGEPFWYTRLEVRFIAAQLVTAKINWERWQGLIQPFVDATMGFKEAGCWVREVRLIGGPLAIADPDLGRTDLLTFYGVMYYRVRVT